MIDTVRDDTVGLVPPQYSICGVRFDFIDYEAAFETMDRWRSTGQRSYVTIANPRDVRQCWRDSEFREITRGSGLTLPDGVGIVLAANILGYRNHGRVTGPTLMLKVCDWGREQHFRHYFYGGAEGIPERLRDRLTAQFPGLQVVGAYSPPFRPLSPSEDDQIVRRINDTGADIVWVGLGAPKQERWIAEHLGRIQAPVMIGVGAAFDFHSGNTQWAPSWVRRIGCEWAWRLVLEPKRMWRRNLDSPVFLAQVITQRLRFAPARRPG